MTPDEAQRLTASPVRAIDLAWPSKPPRWLRLAPSSKPVVLIETCCARPRIIDRVDLRSARAVVELSRYALDPK